MSWFRSGTDPEVAQAAGATRVRPSGWNLPRQRRITRAQFSVTIPALRDAQVAVDAGCILDDTNHGSETTLNVGTSSTPPRESYIAFNVAGLPANAVMVSAALDVWVQSSNVLLASNQEPRGIAPGDEGWTEAGIICSNRPAVTATLGAVQTIPTSLAAGTPGTFPFNSAGLTHLKARFGVGAFTVCLRTPTGELVNNGAMSWRSREHATVEHRPALRAVFTVPV